MRRTYQTLAVLLSYFLLDVAAQAAAITLNNRSNCDSFRHTGGV
ncbi:MAG: hypothetical protein ACO1SX_04365 [Actinomycetota bacterium]